MFAQTWVPPTVSPTVTCSYFFFSSQKYANGENLYAGGLTHFQRKRRSEVSSCPHALTAHSLCPFMSTLFHEAPVWDTVLLLQSILWSETHWCLLKPHHYSWLSVAFTVFTKNKCLRPADWLMEGLVSLALSLRHQLAVTVRDKFYTERTEHCHHAVWQSCCVTLQIKKRPSISLFFPQ